jgi:hypothetical protein
MGLFSHLAAETLTPSGFVFDVSMGSFLRLRQLTDCLSRFFAKLQDHLGGAS